MKHIVNAYGAALRPGGDGSGAGRPGDGIDLALAALVYRAVVAAERLAGAAGTLARGVAARLSRAADRGPGLLRRPDRHRPAL